ncbi:unnamed protein product [Absidia cylindrospora]
MKKDNGLESTLDKAQARINGLSQSPVASTDGAIAIALERMWIGFAGLLEIYHRSVVLLRMISNATGLEILVNGQRWNDLAIDSMIGTAR